MNRCLILTLAIILLIFFGSSSTSYSGPMQDGFDAYKREDFKESFKYFQLAAEQGDAGAGGCKGVDVEGRAATATGEHGRDAKISAALRHAPFVEGDLC